MALLVLVAVAIGGLAGGVLLDRAVLLHKPVYRSGPPGGGRGRERGGGPGDMRRRMSERMARELSLTPTQQVQADSILAHQFKAMDMVSAETRPRIDSIMKQAQRSLDSVLTPEQRVKLDSLRARSRSRGRGGSGGPG
jgi:Spy/CpxP family protein refolding chaperone